MSSTQQLLLGEGAGGAAPVYIEDVFSTYLWTGTGATQTITNGIDLSTKGGLVWIKSRSNATSHALFDTVRGATKFVTTDTTNSQDTISDTLTAFNTTGFTLGSDALDGKVNTSPRTYVGWTFREQPKFFDVVTYTGTGASQTVSHLLNGTVGALIIKKTSGTGNWVTFTRTGGAAGSTTYNYFNTNAGLNLTAGANAAGVAAEAAGIITTTSFNPNDLSGSGASGNVNNINDSGATYVAYLFAHNAGGFGAAGTDNVVSCGVFTIGGSDSATVNLGYEPQWLLFKRRSSNSNWQLVDSLRGMPDDGNNQTDSALYPNSADAEERRAYANPTATGFVYHADGTGVSGDVYMYIAIRRGPMKVPTVGTSVFSPISSTASTGTTLTTNFPVDMQFEGYPLGDSLNMSINDRLRGVSTNTTQSTNILVTSSIGAEQSPNATMTNFWDNTGFKMPSYFGGAGYTSWNFRRAPSFFDEVCYTGTGTAGETFSHNLGVVPELMIVKRRSASNSWTVYSASALNTQYFELNSTIGATVGTTRWNSTSPTASVFTVGTIATVNLAGATYVNYLFATCAGVSKVGSYTGTASTQTINCGFTGGARFVLIKRSDSTGDWFVWDTARGMVSGTDPYQLLNTTTAETNSNFVFTIATGFQIVTTNPGVNASGGTYIFLAIA
jgi:hypothetical protein